MKQQDKEHEKEQGKEYAGTFHPKKIGIMGAGSYIGTSFAAYLSKHFPGQYQVDTMDMLGDEWREKSFAGYDSLFHVAGIAHSDTKKLHKEQIEAYYQVNRDLTIETAKKAKADGVKQFVFMSSAIVYGESASVGKPKWITKETPPSPSNVYGDSKLQAEKGLRRLADETFRVVILRPPMVYGRGCKGNYTKLASLAQKIPVFPAIKNYRSMLYIDHLCEFVRLVIEREEEGVFWPQNAEYSNTSELVKEIARVHGKTVCLIKGLTWAAKLAEPVFPSVKKVFGNFCYEQEMGQYEIEYRNYSLAQSIVLTEKTEKEKEFPKTKKANARKEGNKFPNEKDGDLQKEGNMFQELQEAKTPRKQALVIASVASMIEQFNLPHIQLLQKLGYEVEVACNFQEGSTCSKETIQRLQEKLTDLQVTYYQVDFARDVLQIQQNRTAYQELKQIAARKQYDLVHCHSPIGGVLGRLAFRNYRRTGTKVLYTAHGFHFYKGTSWQDTPWKNWLLYYSVEKLCAHFTDVLITINQEDYRLAKRKFAAKQVRYVPGIGIDVDGIAERADKTNREQKRKELGIPEEAVVLVSVGELSERKNHMAVLEALRLWKVNDPFFSKELYYLICGQGALKKELLQKAEKYGITKNVHLLGYREDVIELVAMSDLFVFPSKQEGLPVALMEAMSVGVSCVASDIRGNRDLLAKWKSKEAKQGSYHKLFALYSLEELAEVMQDMVEQLEKMEAKEREGRRKESRKKMWKYSREVVMARMAEIYRNAKKN